MGRKYNKKTKCNVPSCDICGKFVDHVVLDLNLFHDDRRPVIVPTDFIIYQNEEYVIICSKCKIKRNEL